jgi:dienelactone hydrolase
LIQHQPKEKVAMSATPAPRTRRYDEQRWLLDVAIATVGVEWDQPRLAYTQAPCGAEAAPDFRTVAAQVKRAVDIGPAFEAAAALREAKARQAEAEGHVETAREHYFVAALLWGSAQWPYHENNEPNLRCNERKNACYEAWARQAPHRVERVEIPFGAVTLPAYFHLPPSGPSPFPTAIKISGMDGIKELSVAQYGDKFLERGMAVLAIDGPGQGECCLRDIHTTATNWEEAGRAMVDWLVARPEVDAERLAVTGQSFGSFWATQVAGAEPRLRACAVAAVCHEPGCHTIFNVASPTFKMRYMYMAGYADEAAFDRFAETLTPLPSAERIRCPYLVLAGEEDQLSPIENTYRLVERVQAPKQLVIYQGDRHSIGGSPAAYRGPAPSSLLADWVRDRLDGKPVPSERWYVQNSGQVLKSPL